MKKLLMIVLCVAIVGLLFPANSMAATEAEKQAAIDAGLAYLAAHQQADGRWDAGDDNYDTASTGSALLAFLEEGYTAGTDVVISGTNYGDVVGDGLQFLFSKATTYAISAEPAGNPDSDGNGVGVKFVPGQNNFRDTYVTGLVLPAIASTGTPNAVVTNGALAGWTYEQVVQNTVDYFAYGQADSGDARGGWRYYADYGQSDNSTAQWPPIAMLFAQKMGVNTPQFVKDELDYWIDYIQYLEDPPGTGIHGSSGYSTPDYLNNEAKTGGLLVEMAFAGGYGGSAEESAALAYLNREWQDIQSSTWYGNFGHPYAMWSIYKGLEATIGLNDMGTITNLHADPGDVDNPNHGWNWWEDYCEWLVSNQVADGSWVGYSNWNKWLAIPWYINILAATEIPDNNEPVPEPATMLLLGSGLIGLAGFRKKFMKK